jgi:expansin (peptidoglycan-binding protein)
MGRIFFVGLVLVAACGSDGGSATPTGPGPALGQTETGGATYYDATGAGSCSFDASPSDLDVAAMNHVQYDNSAVCGECLHVVGPKGDVTVRIVDLCPGCAKGGLDLSAQAFAKIADPSAGNVPITWQVVACGVQGPIQYHFKDGSSQWWTAIQIRNHRVPVTKVEVKKAGGAWTEVARVDYNYFVVTSGVGPGAFGVRVTGQTGSVVEDSIPSVTADATLAGSGQL